MTLTEALEFSPIVTRPNFNAFGRIIDTGNAILFTYRGINTNYSQRLSLEDITARDWMVG